jgi:hypothetical protein
MEGEGGQIIAVQIIFVDLAAMYDVLIASLKLLNFFYRI